MGHIVPKNEDNNQDDPLLKSGLAAGILETGSSPDSLAFRRKKQQEKGNTTCQHVCSVSVVGSSC